MYNKSHSLATDKMEIVLIRSNEGRSGEEKQRGWIGKIFARFLYEHYLGTSTISIQSARFKPQKWMCCAVYEYIILYCVEPMHFFKKNIDRITQSSASFKVIKSIFGPTIELNAITVLTLWDAPIPFLLFQQ